MDVSIIIPVYNNLKAIKQTLKALKKQSYPRDKYEIIVIDNGSSDGTIEWLREQQDIILINENNYKNSPYSSRNRGIEIAKSKIIGLLDATCVPEENWIDNGIKFFQFTNYDLFGGNVKFDFEDKITAGKIYDSITNIQMKYSIINKKAAKTANLWVKKCLFNKMGYFKEGVRSGEDVGWTSRCTKEGYKIGFCESCVVRKFARNTRELLIKQVRVGKGQILLWKNKGMLRKNLLKSSRKLIPISPRTLKTLMKRNKEIKYTHILVLKIYLVSYIANLATFYGNIKGLLKFK